MPGLITSLINTSDNRLYAISSDNQLHLSTDSAVTWTSYTPSANNSIGQGKFIPDSTTDLYVVTGDSLSKLSITGNGYSATILTTFSGLYASASLNQDVIHLIYYSSQDGAIQGTSSSDKGSTWSQAQTISTVASLEYISPLDHSYRGESVFVSATSSAITLHLSPDNGTTWQSKTIAQDKDASSTLAYQRSQGVDQILYLSSSVPVLSESVNSGDNWATSRNSDFSGSLSFAFFSTDRTPLVLSNRSRLYRYTTPFSLHPMSKAFLNVELNRFTLDWQAHPKAESYDIYRGTTFLATTTTAPIEMNLSLENNEELSIHPKRSGKAGQALTFTYTQSNESNTKYLLNTGTSAADFKIYAFPHNAWVNQDGNSFSIKATFQSLFGTQNNSSIWRFGRWNPSTENYTLFEDISNIEAGAGYWLISAFNIEINVSYREAQGDNALVRLKPGWNMFASPFFSNINLGQVQFLDDMRSYGYNDLISSPATLINPTCWRWTNTGYQQTSDLEAGQGYWIKNSLDRDLLMLIDKTSNAKSLNPPLARGQSQDQPPDPPEFSSSTTASSSGGGGGGCFLLR